MQKKDFTRVYSNDFYRRFSDVDPFDSPQEECGIFGVFNPKNIDTFSMQQFGMFALQHRGQEAAGISVLKEKQISTYKHAGLVLDLFKNIEIPEDFQGNAAIGHTRYTTAGDNSSKNFQPLYARGMYGEVKFSIAHNGNLVNDHNLREELAQEGLPFLANSDTEVMLRLIQRNADLPIYEAVKKTVAQIKGAYSVLLLTRDALAAFRDPNGIRPLCIGKRDDGTYVFSSESCGIDAVNATYIRDVKPGELVIVNAEGLHSYNLSDPDQKASCAFEFIYFSRPDSEMENKSVYDVRVQCGEALYAQNPVEADYVVGVPDSGVPSAIGFSKASGIPFRPILVKNKYIGRSFIVPTQEMREQIVNLKLNPIIPKIKGKRLVILDDSIVRGTTSKRLVAILKKAGAKEIHFRSASPPIIAPCFLGIDTPSKAQLISANMNMQQLKDYLAVDSLDFLSVENLEKILGSKKHCFGCFTEKYPVFPDPKK